MTTYLPPKKNTAFVFYVSLVSQASRPAFQANPTLAAGDVKVAIDDGAPANLTTLPAVDADFTKRVKVSLSSAEMNGDNITVIFSDAAGAEWDDLTVNLQTVTTSQIDDLATAASVSALPTANNNADALLDRANGIETSYTLRQALRLILASLVGEVSGASSTTITFRDINDTVDRIVATVDAYGNRSAVTKDVA